MARDKSYDDDDDERTTRTASQRPWKKRRERERKGCIVLLHDKRFRIVATNVPTNSAPLFPRSGRGEEEEEVPEGEVDRRISREREREGRREREGGEMRIERKGRKEEGRGGERERSGARDKGGRR